MKHPRLVSAVVDPEGAVVLDSHPAAVFPWWSVTKTAIAVCMLRLWEQGRLSLDATLPDSAYSLRQLAGHQAGVPEYSKLSSYRQAVAARDEPWPLQHLLEAVGSELDFTPGTGWGYSNTGYLMLRQWLERICDAPLGEVLQAELLRPLGLSKVRLAGAVADFDTIYWGNSEGYHPDWAYHGCLMGTAREAAQMMYYLLSGDVLGAKAQTMLRAPVMSGGGIQGRVWTQTGYGLGLMNGMARGVGAVLGHSGCGPFCANFVGQFATGPTLAVASFCDVGDETAAENEAVRLAQDLGHNLR